LPVARVPRDRPLPCQPRARRAVPRTRARPRPRRAMRIPITHVDAFASQVFRGNPAAICPLESWLDDATLQAIAAENNLSETAFLVGGDGAYEIRGMTPKQEGDVCVTATLATAVGLVAVGE